MYIPPDLSSYIGIPRSVCNGINLRNDGELALDLSVSVIETPSSLI